MMTCALICISFLASWASLPFYDGFSIDRNGKTETSPENLRWQKKKGTNQKHRVVDAFCKGMDLTDNARERCVKGPSMRFNDALVAGENVDRERLGKVFYETKEHFLSLQEELLLKFRLS